jgi:hypothetical protein
VAPAGLRAARRNRHRPEPVRKPVPSLAAVFRSGGAVLRHPAWRSSTTDPSGYRGGSDRDRIGDLFRELAALPALSS